MPIKVDGEGRRWVEMHVFVAGSPTDVWRAMATGPGNSTWFTKTTIDERVGGVVRFEFGAGMTSTGEVTTWEPPHRFGYVEREWNEGAPPIATEILITERSRNHCIVQMTHEISSYSDAWDEQMESFEDGWPGFFEVLRIYLEHFKGTKGASFQIVASALPIDNLAIWTRLTQKLGFAGANVGECCENTSTPEPWSGTVERIDQNHNVRYAILRLDAPVAGVIIVGTYRSEQGVHVSLTRYFYGGDAKEMAQKSEVVWRQWFDDVFPSEQTT